MEDRELIVGTQKEDLEVALKWVTGALVSYGAELIMQEDYRLTDDVLFNDLADLRKEMKEMIKRFG